MNADHKKSLREIRQQARELLLGRWQRHTAAAGVVLLGILFSSFLTGLFGSSFSAWLMSLGVAAILDLFTGLLFDGILLYCLHLADGSEAALYDVFVPFRNSPDRFLLVRLIKLGANLIFFLPAVILSMMNYRHPGITGILAISCAVAGGVAACIFRVATAFTGFLLFDEENDEAGALELLRRSMELTRGRRIRIFLLLLSFLGYYLIGLFTAGLGFLWVIPYVMASFSLFYRDAVC